MSNKQELFYDVLIAGAGPAGLSAAIYAARGNLKTAIIDTNMFGGKPSEYLKIENYPGFSSINACELIEKFEEHADMFGADKYPFSQILRVNLTSDIKEIETEDYLFKAKSVIIATGTKSKKLNIPGEDEFKCRGVSYCAICDGAFFKDKVLAVIGGGNSALEEAAYLTEFAKKVYVIHRRNEFKADKLIQERAKSNEKLEFVLNCVPVEIKGDDSVKSIVIKDVNTGEIKELALEGVFPYIGDEPAVELFSGQLAQTPQGYIETDVNTQTSVKGVFAAGDVRNTPLRQVITAAADGAVAACSAVKYIEEQKYVNTI